MSGSLGTGNFDSQTQFNATRKANDMIVKGVEVSQGAEAALTQWMQGHVNKKGLVPRERYLSRAIVGHRPYRVAFREIRLDR